MKLSIHNWMRAETVETTIRRIARHGYTKLEIAGDPQAYDTKEVRRLLKENGLACWGSVILMLED
jgi:D-psicose/D-tagatose/L-ribulose 3-epimerase